jgi:hypothetical protein
VTCLISARGWRRVEGGSAAVDTQERERLVCVMGIVEMAGLGLGDSEGDDGDSARRDGIRRGER